MLCRHHDFRFLPTLSLTLLLTLAPLSLSGQQDEQTHVIFTPRLLDAAAAAERFPLLEQPLNPVTPPAISPDDAGPMPDSELSYNMDRYRQEVDRLVAEGGAYNADLTENLIAMAESQRRAGNPEEALELFDRAFHIIRIHEGLFSAGQMPVINSITQTLLDMGNFEEAHNRQDYLYYLRYKLHPQDNSANLKALLDLAGWSLGIASLAYDRDFSRTSVFQFNRLIESSTYFNNAVDYLLDHSPEDNRLPGIQRDRALANYQLARLSTLFDSSSAAEISPSFRSSSPIISNHYTSIDTTASFNQDISSNYSSQLSHFRSSAYNEGTEALQQRMEYLKEHGEAADAIRAAVDLADWHLVFQRRNDALEAYSQALALWESASLDEELRFSLYDELFYPATPHNIPDLHSPWIAESGDPAGFHGYVDIAFNVSRYGTTQRIQVTGSSEGTDNSLIRELRQRIDNAVYRPRFLDGEPLTNDSYSLRYYYSFVRNTPQDEDGN